MAKELEVTFPVSGLASCYVILYNVTLQPWYTTTPAFETWNGTHRANYKLTVTESGEYTYYADMPAGVTTPGYYQYVMYNSSDAVIGSGSFFWDGAHIIAGPLDQSATISVAPTVGTVGEALSSARAQGFGKWVLNTGAKTITLYAHDGTTVIYTLTLDSVTATTQRA